MNDYSDLEEMLEKSVKINGEKVLTNKWLLNIIKKVNKNNARLENTCHFDPNWD